MFDMTFLYYEEQGYDEITAYLLALHDMGIMGEPSYV